MTKVLISDKLAKEAVDIFVEAGIEVDFKPGLSADEIAEIIGDYDGLAIVQQPRLRRNYWRGQIS